MLSMEGPGGALRAAVLSHRCCRPLVPVLLSLGLTLVACSIRDDYETLSFWFDGVPTPEELDAAEAEQEAEQAATLRRKRDPIALPAGYSRHLPYAQKDCEACHVADFRRGSGFSIRVPELRLPAEKLCLSCHEAEQGASTHGPSASGSCLICHVPHHSANPSLLRYPEQRGLCTECHTGPFFASAAEHEAWSGQDCTACHDPHAAPHPALLREPPER